MSDRALVLWWRACFGTVAASVAVLIVSLIGHEVSPGASSLVVLGWTLPSGALAFGVFWWLSRNAWSSLR